MLFQILLIIFLVGANGFFVAAEFALVKVRLTDIEALARQGRKTAMIAEHILGRLDTYLSACQLGITLASLGLGWIGEPFVATMLEPLALALGIPADMTHYISLPLAFFTITFLHITAGEQVPKMLAIQKNKAATLVVGIPLMIFFKALRPFIWFLNTSSNLMLRAIGVTLVSDHENSLTVTELRMILINSAAGGHVSRRERLLMENVLDLESKSARRYMLPRHQIVFLDRNEDMETKLRVVAESGHTRFPLCDGDLDHIIGIVHVKDIFKAIQAGQPLTSLMGVARDPLFLPETIRLDVLLLEFQRRKTVLAMLVDEYGVVSGMITLENVIEELVGPIQDEFDSESPLIIRKGVHRFEVEARCPVDLVVEGCELQLPEEITSDTIGGVMIELLGHIPREGEKARVGQHDMTVLLAEPTRIRKLLIERIIPAPEARPTDSEAGA